MYYESKRCDYGNCDAPVMMSDDYGMTGRLCRYHYYKWLEYEEERKAEEKAEKKAEEKAEEERKREQRERIKQYNEQKQREIHLLLNKLEDNPESLKYMKELRIDVFGTPHTTLPDSIGSLINLEKLSIDGWKNLKELPNSIGQLTNLTSLDLKWNGLTNLPESIGQLVNLTHLTLFYNELTNLPESIGRLTNLTSLDLGGNTLTNLPESIGQLTNLTYLNLYHNQLTNLPESIGRLTNLTSLDLGGNTLTTLPESIVKLTNLNYFRWQEKELKGNISEQLKNEIAVQEFRKQQKELEKLANEEWEKIKDSDLITAFEDFLKQQPNCSYVLKNSITYKIEELKKQAKLQKQKELKKLANDEWEKIKNSSSIAVFEDFLKRHPNCSSVLKNSITCKIDELKKQAELQKQKELDKLANDEWEKIRDSNSIAVFEDFLKHKQNCSSTLKDSVTFRIKDLKKQAEEERLRIERASRLKDEQEDRERLFKFVGGMATKATDLAGDAINQLSQSEAIKKAKDLIDKEELSSVAESLKMGAVETITKLSNRFKNWKL